ncbi:hypothetical protein BATDEDRAFT_85524 [Batrachochytrium dendrobatidis JAM81]|uniref:Uncharacterized protein n=1 Tax=Batrachochytrium dendrobatidis (strain JAM81 / FGSC 10211) TaxID=684364 RepID=F4NTQ8_BATDJ|nr:uncharacterized protein BATDEDRAFT_85524 [Batrachochytrium dendrobatidis JAM81]EGF83939.1 hypothetical protein BATDEDRAFT_85524 [Batrachochytrium dendrobatidis JAM81]|eukprot:XP_006676284.1 hypothetical protein BATDEDRAFT_85524 [Batrachochytrium dendrobatidis JAM81]
MNHDKTNVLSHQLQAMKMPDLIIKQSQSPQHHTTQSYCPLSLRPPTLESLCDTSTDYLDIFVDLKSNSQKPTNTIESIPGERFNPLLGDTIIQFANI